MGRRLRWLVAVLVLALTFWLGHLVLGSLLAVVCDAQRAGYSP